MRARKRRHHLNNNSPSRRAARKAKLAPARAMARRTPGAVAVGAARAATVVEQGAAATRWTA